MIKALDFCCGAGGITRGLLDAGIALAAGIDQDRRLRQTYEANNAPTRFIADDITTINIHELCPRLDISTEDTGLYAAGPPGQPFSNLKTTMNPDARSSLLLAFGRIIEVHPPDFIPVENVPGLGNSRDKAIQNEFLEILKHNSFQWTTARLDAKDYRVPQTHKRFILNSIPETARQVGNAVPVKLAQVLSQAIIGLAHPEQVDQRKQP